MHDHQWKINVAEMINQKDESYAYKTEHDHQKTPELLPGALEQFPVAALLVEEYPYQ